MFSQNRYVTLFSAPSAVVIVLVCVV